MSRAELKSLVDRCTHTDRHYLVAYLRTKNPEYRRRLANADRDVDSGRCVRLRAMRRGLARVAI